MDGVYICSCKACGTEIPGYTDADDRICWPCAELMLAQVFKEGGYGYADLGE